MKVFWCCFDSQWDEWGCFVVADRRGVAKRLFLQEFKDDGEWNDIRCHIVKEISDDILIAPQCLDMPNDPVLKLLGLEYREDDE